MDCFARDCVAELIRQHEQAEFDHAYRLWALLVLELWMQQLVRFSYLASSRTTATMNGAQRDGCRPCQP